MDTNDIMEYCRSTYPYSSHGFVVEDEYKRDILRFMMLKRMTIRYLKHGTINHKAILNNIIVLVNLFGRETVLHIFSKVFTESEKSVIYSFTNWLKLTNLSQSSENISDLLLDYSTRK